MVFAHGALYTYLSLYLAQLGYSKTAIGAFWVVSVVLEIAFFLTQGKWFARFGVFPLMTFAFGVAAVRFLLIAELATVWWILVLAQAMHAVTFAVHHSASVLTIQRWFPGRAAARGQALYISMAYGLGGTVGQPGRRVAVVGRSVRPGPSLPAARARSSASGRRCGCGEPIATGRSRTA